MTMSAGCHCFHIIIIYGKDVWTEEIPIPFILYRCVILKNIVGTLADFGRCPFCMQKWVTKLAGTGFLYTDKSRMKKA